MIDTKYYVDASGIYLGAFCGVEPSTGAIEVPSPPVDARDTWQFPGWDCIGRQRMEFISAINDERDRREELGFPYRGKLLDSTPRSVQRITAAALAAQAVLATGQPYSVDWVCADNSTLILDAAGVIGMPVALALHAAALHDHARVLKAAVADAGSEAELAAIDIQAGWPGGAA